MQKIRWGLVSTARINRRLIPAIRSSKRGELTAVASRDKEKSQAYANEWSIPHAFGSYEEMLASDGIDAVYISLPNHLHAEWTIKAMQAGKHVLCEKPFAITLDEVDQMINTSRQTGCVLQEAFMYRHHPQTRLVGEWVRSGRLGEITLVRGFFSFFMGDQPTNVRMIPEYGGGALWDVGIYPLSMAQFVYGELPNAVSGQQHVGKTGVDETFSGLLHYANGRSAHIVGSFEMPFFTQVDIQGTLGSLTLTRPFTNMNERDRQILFTDTSGSVQKLNAAKLEPYLGEVENMHTAILDGSPTIVTLDETRNHIRTALALYESARTGQTVAV